MSALMLPKRYSVNKTNHFLARKIGIKIDGVEMPNNVQEYDVEKGTYRLTGETEMRSGVVEPYWK